MAWSAQHRGLDDIQARIEEPKHALVTHLDDLDEAVQRCIGHQLDPRVKATPTVSPRVISSASGNTMPRPPVE